MISTQAIRDKLTQSLLKEAKGYFEEKTFNFPQKSATLQETRCFTESPLNLRRCCETVIKVLYLIHAQNDPLTPAETADLFFSTTRLFQSNDQRLRRLVYLLLKSIQVQDIKVFILTNALTNDMKSDNDCYKANSIKVLSRIIDPSMVSQIDRYLKTAVIDKNPFVSSAALTCGIALLKLAPEIVKQWVNEVSQTLYSKDPMVQFHSLLLLYELKRSDLLGIKKLVSNIIDKGNFFKSPLSDCMVIRYVVNLLKVMGGGAVVPAASIAGSVLPHERGAGGFSVANEAIAMKKFLLEFLRTSLHNRSEIAMFEAAKGFCSLAVSVGAGVHNGTTINIYGFDIIPAVTILQILVTSPKSVLRFAAIKQINMLAQAYPFIVSRWDIEVEPLLADSNRNIATLALTTLLKVGNESNIDRLIKQISSFVNEVSDSFKLDIMKAVRVMCVNYPSKHKLLMSVLSSNFRLDGGFAFKSQAVDALIFLIETIPQSQESGLLQLCEFIEDCEFPLLCVRILTFLGNIVPTMEAPSRYIRFIYNRLMLESPMVRAAGVDALTKIAARCPFLRKDIITLLNFCVLDNDDEVRDRCCLYLQAIEKQQHEPSSKRVSDGYYGKETKHEGSVGSNDKNTGILVDLLQTSSDVSLEDLTEKLASHIQYGHGDKPFDISSVPKEANFEKKAADMAGWKPGSVKGVGEFEVDSEQGVSGPGAGALGAGKLPPSYYLMSSELGYSVDGIHMSTHETSEQALFMGVEGIIAAQELGKLLLVGAPIFITETEDEYTVKARKFIFPSHIILEFEVTNTLENQVLDDLTVELTRYDHSLWQVKGSTAIRHLSSKSSSIVYSVLWSRKSFEVPALVDELRSSTSNRSQQLRSVATGHFDVVLNFTLKEQDDALGYRDSYRVEAVVVTISDYLTPRELPTGEFKLRWDKIMSPPAVSTSPAGAQGSELVGKFSLSFKTIDAAVKELMHSLQLAACDGSEIVDPSKKLHSLLLSGLAFGESLVLCIATIAMTSEHGCLLQLHCRSSFADICAAIIDSVG